MIRKKKKKDQQAFEAAEYLGTLRNKQSSLYN